MSSSDAPEVASVVGEACQLLAAIATELPERSRVELTRLLGHSVVMPTTQELREMRLGLLVELVASSGELPTTETYDHLRTYRNIEGAAWPGSTGLAAHYGTWASVLRAATDVAFAQTPGRIRAITPRPWPLRTYTRAEITEALKRCSRKVGQTIGQWEYVELRRVERQLAARTGAEDPRLPALQVIHKHFGSWEAAASNSRFEGPELRRQALHAAGTGSSPPFRCL